MAGPVGRRRQVRAHPLPLSAGPAGAVTDAFGHRPPLTRKSSRPATSPGPGCCPGQPLILTSPFEQL